MRTDSKEGSPPSVDVSVARSEQDEPQDRKPLRRRNRWLRIIVPSALVFLILYGVLSLVVASQLTKGTREPRTVTATAIGANYESVSFPSRVDKLTLRGWLFHSPDATGRSVIFVHGMQSNRLDTNSGLYLKAHDMIGHGYDALLFDLRANGESDGDRFTMGTTEPRDILGAYDFMRSRGYEPRHMAVLAVSMGASIAIQAAPEMSDVGGIVADTAYAELRPVLEKDLPNKSHLPGWLFNWGIISAGQLFFGLNPDLRPVDTVRAVPNVAFLFVQAPEDTVTPPSNAEMLARASANPQSRLVLIHSEIGHTKAYLTHPIEYMAAVYAFLDKQLQ